MLSLSACMPGIQAGGVETDFGFIHTIKMLCLLPHNSKKTAFQFFWDRFKICLVIICVLGPDGLSGCCHIF